METKKSEKANLEKRKGLFVEIGLVIALGIVLLALNVKSYDQEEVVVSERTAIEEIDETILQTQEQEKPPEPPAPEAPEVTTELNVIDNEAESENMLGVVDFGDDANTEVEEFTPAVVEEQQEVEEEEVFVFVEEKASFPGGEEALFKYLSDNLKYPEMARTGNIEGMVYIRFVVEKDGSITNPVIMRDIGGGCGAEALRVVKAMPKWKPAKQRNRTVRSQFDLPVRFTLH